MANDKPKPRDVNDCLDYVQMSGLRRVANWTLPNDSPKMDEDAELAAFKETLDENAKAFFDAVIAKK